ncbi:MAG: hypothetical protein RMJ54_09395 [Roseiflexaceae bacterium]|nr:hypothetical protein [Roseiflexus sp.]MDW8232983.1 hypothetical protein [Roseiflexaceae bacterium]
MPRYHTPKEYLDAARSPETSPEELRELATSPYNFVAIAVAQHPNTEPDVLAALLPATITSWNEQALAAAIAQHPRTPVEALEILAERLAPVLDNGREHQIGFRAGVLLCCNPKTPFRAIAALLRSEIAATQFRKVVARETRRRDVLELLLHDRSETVKKRAQKSIEALDGEHEERLT